MEVKIVAGVEALLAFGADVASKVALVGRLVGRETNVAVDAVCAVFYVEVADGGVKLGNADQQAFYDVVKLGVNLVVPTAIGLKPLAGIVGSKFAEKMEYILHGCGEAN